MNKNLIEKNRINFFFHLYNESRFFLSKYFITKIFFTRIRKVVEVDEVEGEIDE